MLSHSTLDDIEYSHSTRKAIKRHRRHSKSKRKTHKHFKNYASDKCAVCLDESTTLDTKLFPCGHAFHGQCLIQWVTVQKGRKFNCPLCRADIANFVQITGNEQINAQLIQIWNEHCLYGTDTQESDTTDKTVSKMDIAADEPVKAKVNCAPQTSLLQSRTALCVSELAHVKKVEISEENTKDKTVDSIEINSVGRSEVQLQKMEKRSTHSGVSLWHFIWNSPLSMLYKQTSMRSSFAIMDFLLYPMQTGISLEQIYDTSSQDTQERLYLKNNSSEMFPFQTGKKPTQIRNKSFETDTFVKGLDIQSKLNANMDFLSFISLNLQSGILAGICAGTTTCLVSQQIKRGLSAGFMHSSLRNSLFPILSETVPNVAIFFTAYEHLKQYVFQTDTTHDSPAQTFGKRFMSAGMASSVSYFIVNGGKTNNYNRGLLPARFAAFFGTFEFCKDWLDFNHENIGFFGIASSAAVGGTVSHGMCYPLMQYRNSVFGSIDNVPIMNAGEGGMGYEMYHSNARQMFVRNLFKGWVSSLSKFLPSCVVCSCAFEYSKRYLKNA